VLLWSLNTKKHADGNVSISGYCNKIHFDIEGSQDTDWRVRIRKYLIEVYWYFSSWCRHHHIFSDGRSNILCNVSTLLHGVTSKKTVKFILSAMTETTGMNAIHITWRREYAVKHNRTLSALITGLNTARYQGKHTTQAYLLNEVVTPTAVSAHRWITQWLVTQQTYLRVSGHPASD
jgi:hypothetical protein